MLAGKSIFLSMIIGMVLVVGACSDTRDKQGVQEPVPDNRPLPVNYGFINTLKESTFPIYPSVTIGKAFDSYKYLQNKEWAVEAQQSKQFLITYSGWFDPRMMDEQAVKDGVTARGIEVRFMMDPNGSFSLKTISVIEKRSDGSLYRSRTLDIGSTLEKIYANDKIKL